MPVVRVEKKALKQWGERERETRVGGGGGGGGGGGRETRQDKTNSLYMRVVNKHTSAFFHSALAQRGTNY